MRDVQDKRVRPMKMWHSRLGCVNQRRDAHHDASWSVRALGVSLARPVEECRTGVPPVLTAETAVPRSFSLPNAGFTLVEVLAAVAILGGAVFILLNTHYSALRLYEQMNESVVKRQLLERLVGEAEFGVLSGEISGGGEFEGRYAGYTWSYQGTPTGGTEEAPIPFYQVEATLRTPDGEDESLTFYLFNVGSDEVLEGST